jgi:2-methylcitrate dehydratase PrpD
MGIANILGAYVYRASYNDLHQTVITNTKYRLLDFLGCAFDSYWRQPMEPVLRVVKLYGTKEEATVIGEGIKLPCSLAAMVNSHYSMIQDGSRFAAQHQGCIVIPAALAVSETRSNTTVVSGRELILAIALGYEVMLRIGIAMYPSSFKRGFSPTTIHGPIGATIAASKIFGLDEERITNALSIASLMAHGLQAANRAPHPLFSFQVGRASEAGVLCALLVQAGLKGSDEILEEGFFSAFSDECYLDVIEKDLGKDYLILKKTYLKLHGGCRALHVPIDCTLFIKDKYKIGLEDIKQIRIKTCAGPLMAEIKNPKTGREAQYSIAFGVAITFIYGDASPDRFTDSNLRDERIQQLMNMTTIEHDPELDKDTQKRPAIVEIITKGEKVFSHKLEIAKGEPQNPLSKSEIENKFHRLSSRVVNEERRRKIIDFINALEKKDDITDLFPLLKKTSKA